VGTGVACAYVPIVAAVGGWFEQRRATALGVAVAGIGLGTLIGAPSAAALIDWRGFRETYVIFAIISFVGLAACAIVAKRPPGQSAGADSEPDPPVRETLTHPIFVRLYLTSLGLTAAIFVPFVFIVPYAEDRDIGSVAAAVLVGLIGGASVVGRLGLGAMGARISLVRLYRWCYHSIGLSLGLWLIAGSSYPILVLFTIIFGTAYGGWIALSPAVAALFFGARRLGSVLGWLYSGAGIGGLVGPPVLGAAIDVADTYAVAIVGAAVLGLISFVFLLPLKEPAVAATPRITSIETDVEREATGP
jgi:predicted MFS family arabinose efflux permease